jgi:hypothetical protein
LAAAKKYVERRDSFEKGMDAVRAAHKWRSHKKNEPKLVSQNNKESLKHLSKIKNYSSI